MPTLTESIAADEQAIADAQVTLDAAKAKLAADQGAADALAPHVGYLAEFEAAAAKAGGEVEAEILAVVAKVRAFLNI